MGWLTTIHFDEAHEVACQYELRQGAFNKLGAWGKSLSGQTVFWNIMSGSMTATVKSFVLETLGLQLEHTKRIGYAQTDAQDGLIVSSNVKFMAVGGESTSKDVVFTKAVNRAKEAVTSNECALVCVMTVTDGLRV
ncbi:hypothetical protein ScalyP_jg124, partial [Parmales sp. scaly parma]